MEIKFIFKSHCGEKTCAQAKGVFCRMLGFLSVNEDYGYCHAYQKNVFSKNGWLQRCDECLKEHKGNENG